VLQRSVLTALSLFVGACASVPDHLYSLDTVGHPSAASSSDLPVIVVGPVTIPEMVDRPQLVVREGKYGVVVNEQERWATPLKDSLPLVITTQLRDGCPRARFRSLSNTLPENSRTRLVVDFTNIEINRATGVLIVARWAYRDGKRDIEGIGEGHADIESTNYSSYVDAMQRALSAWANHVVTQLPVCQ
jgi:uncharacterized lipoprotein YmbA